MKELEIFLEANATNGLVSKTCLEIARANFSLSHADVERIALRASLLPERYQRNRNSISVEQQSKLFSSRVAIVGCGGLGGYIIEELARLGVGELVIIDPDIFEDHNLNRQLYSSPQVIGQAKATVAAQRIAEVNPAVSAKPIKTQFSINNGPRLLSGVNVVADAVDNVITRFEMAATCSKLGIPLVHGAIAGWYGQVCTIFPEERSLDKIYGNQNDGFGIEQDLGNPAFTPAVIASLQAAEVCKILLGKGNLLRNRKILIDLLNMEFEEILL